MPMQAIVENAWCVPFPVVALVVTGLVGAIVALYRRGNRLADEAIYRLERDANAMRR